MDDDKLLEFFKILNTSVSKLLDLGITRRDTCNLLLSMGLTIGFESIENDQLTYEELELLFDKQRKQLEKMK